MVELGTVKTAFRIQVPYGTSGTRLIRGFLFFQLDTPPPHSPEAEAGGRHRLPSRGLCRHSADELERAAGPRAIAALLFRAFRSFVLARRLRSRSGEVRVRLRTVLQ